MITRTNAQKLGKKIKTARIERRMKQKELAKSLGVFQAQLSMWESGKKLMPTKYLLELPNILGVSLEYFSINSGEKRVQRNESSLILG